MNKLLITDLPFHGLKKISRTRIADDRGFFSRVFCSKELNAVYEFGGISQVNQSFTKKRGTVRGLHFQNFPHAENKIVICIRGSIHDVVVDLRNNSPTFLKHYELELNDQNDEGILIPKGFAHGFQTLEDDCEIIYFHSEAYVPEFEGGLNPLDPSLNIEWPINITCISERDMSHKYLNKQFSGLECQ